MTVKELIQKLSELPQDLHVFVEGYEDGFSDFTISKKINVALNVHKEDYLGPHDEDASSNIAAVVLRRQPNPN